MESIDGVQDLPIRGKVCDRVQEEVRHLTADVSPFVDSNSELSPEIVDKAVDKRDAKVGRVEGCAR